MSRLIDQKYIGMIASRLSLFKKKNRCWNFRCPFCGDSKKKKTLCRGFLFEYKGTTIYKCHNCGLAIGLSAFIKELDPQLAKRYHYETFAESGRPRHVEIPAVVKIDPSTISAQTTSAVLELPTLAELPVGHPATEYSKARQLPPEVYRRIYYAENMRVLEHLAPDRYANVIPTDARLIFPYYYEGALVGVTGRAINPKAHKRYIQMRFREDVPLVFGLDVFDKKQATYIVEGPIDSLFLPNAIACGGMDFQKILDLELVDRLLTTIVFDNQPRNKDVVKRMLSMVGKKWETAVWPKSWPYKDINEAVMAGIDPTIVKAIIDSNAFISLQLQLAVNTWRKC